MSSWDLGFKSLHFHKAHWGALIFSISLSLNWQAVVGIKWNWEWQLCMSPWTLWRKRVIDMQYKKEKNECGNLTMSEIAVFSLWTSHYFFSHNAAEWITPTTAKLHNIYIDLYAYIYFSSTGMETEQCRSPLINFQNTECINKGRVMCNIHLMAMMNEQN